MGPCLQLQAGDAGASLGAGGDLEGVLLEEGVLHRDGPAGPGEAEPGHGIGGAAVEEAVPHGVGRDERAREPAAPRDQPPPT